METGKLAAALRNKATEVRNLFAGLIAQNATTAEEEQTLRDAADLLRVLAHVVDGKPLAKAFGSPGDWGYDTAIGAAIAAAPVTPNLELTGAARHESETKP